MQEDPVTRAAIDSRVARVEEAVASIAVSVDRLGRSIESLQVSFNASQRTDWKTLSAFGALILMLVGAAGAPYIFQLQRTQDMISDYPAIKQRAYDHRERLDSLDASVQREMRDLDATLQAEIKGGDAVAAERLRALERAVFKEK